MSVRAAGPDVRARSRVLLRGLIVLAARCVLRPSSTFAQATAPAVRELAQRSDARARAAATLEGVVRSVGVRDESFALPPARSFCGAPVEPFVRAQLGDRLPPCDAPEARLTLRAVDRTVDRLDVQWRAARPATAPEAPVEHRHWFVFDDEVLEPGDRRLAQMAADPVRHDRDVFRTALLLLLGPADRASPSAGRCALALDEAPPGLARAFELAPTGLYASPARDGAATALVWISCMPDGRDPAVRDPNARSFVLAAVQVGPSRSIRVEPRVRFCHGIDRCASPP